MEHGRSSPQRLVVCLAAVSVLLLVASCATRRGGTRHGHLVDLGLVITNLVYLDDSASPPTVGVIQLTGTGAGAMNTNDVPQDTEIYWIGAATNANPWEFSIVFSRKDNPHGNPNWSFQHSSNGDPHIKAHRDPKVSVKTFKYTVTASQEAPIPSTGGTGDATSSVVVTSRDPFIIIR